MIKKHRRNQINFEETPRNEKKLVIISDSVDNKIRSEEGREEINSDVEERVDFTALYDAMKSTSKTPSEISTIDISSPLVYFISFFGEYILPITI